MLKLVSLAVGAIRLMLIVVGIGPQRTDLRLVQSVSGAAIVVAGGLFFVRVRVDLARMVLAGIATGTFAIGVASARGRPVTDADLLLPMILGLSLVAVEVCGAALRTSDPPVERRDDPCPERKAVASPTAGPGRSSEDRR